MEQQTINQKLYQLICYCKLERNVIQGRLLEDIVISNDTSKENEFSSNYSEIVT